jgi:HD superfamily phosphohydrolase
MAKRAYDPRRDPIEQIKAMDGAQELFLPVHGHVLLYPEEIAVIDHPSFQRLRRVRQLGLAHMVFPGATHTRFEHCVGAVHVAQMIVNHINHNFRKKTSEAAHGEWSYKGVSLPAARFIRLGALLHDIGHLPFGHTLEDELHHLRSHDGGERLALVAGRKYEYYQVDGKAGLRVIPTRPEMGWSLEGLVDSVFQPFAEELGVSVTPFVLLTHIVCKLPKEREKAEQWKTVAAQIDKYLDLDVCRDVVGNTICADFLDYLYRDWHHLGKPLYHDKRLYQYMEVRSHKLETNEQSRGTKFVINVGDPETVRHDALTDILELLNARYKLAETVLFHRTKLALTGLLDRCLLETSALFQQLGFPAEEHRELLEKLLLDSSDDGLVGVLRKLSAGGSVKNKQHFQQAVDSERENVEAQVGKARGLYEAALSTGELHAQQHLVGELIERLNSREVYTRVYKLRMCDFSGPHNSQNPQLLKLLELYRVPENRLMFLRGVEALCNLPVGSLVMYCPKDASMNAKIAKVNLFIDGDVSQFDQYEESQGESGLTHGALGAQIERFYELWSAYVFIKRDCYDHLSPTVQQNLRSVVQCCFYRKDRTTDAKIARSQIQVSVEAVLRESSLTAFRSNFGNPPAVEKFRGFTFPSGVAFGIDA